MTRERYVPIVLCVILVAALVATWFQLPLWVILSGALAMSIGSYLFVPTKWNEMTAKDVAMYKKLRLKPSDERPYQTPWKKWKW